MKNFNQNENQGKSEKQISDSYKIAFYSAIGFLLIICLSIIKNI